MLRRLLQVAARAGTARSTELAHALGASTALIEAMLEELAREDYLRLLAPGSATACERCPARGACLYGKQARVWMLSARGRDCVGIGPGHPPR